MARLDFPDPDTPVTAVNTPSGKATSRSRRLFRVTPASLSQPFGRRDSYDIRDFAANLDGVLDASVDEPARKLITAVDEACVRNVALGPKVDKASGLAFWFPSDSRSFGDTAGTYRELDFDKAVGWASYLSRFLS